MSESTSCNFCTGFGHTLNRCNFLNKVRAHAVKLGIGKVFNRALQEVKIDLDNLPFEDSDNE